MAVFRFAAGSWSAPAILRFGAVNPNGFAVTLSADGNTALVGTDVFQFQNGSRSAPAGLPTDGVYPPAWTDLSDDGTTAVGAVGPMGPSTGNYVEVWSLKEGVWQAPTLLSVNPAVSLFGRVAISSNGDTILASGNDASEHPITHAEIFTASGSGWSGPTDLSNGPVPTRSQIDSHGQPVALSGDGDTAVVGDPARLANGEFFDGGAEVYQFNSTSWSQPIGLSLPRAARWESGAFGTSLAVSNDGSTLVVGAPGSVKLADQPLAPNFAGTVAIFNADLSTVVATAKATQPYGQNPRSRPGSNRRTRPSHIRPGRPRPRLPESPRA